MDDGFAYADILLLALIAGFILLRLRSVLGQKIGHDFSDRPKEAIDAETEEAIVQISEKLRENEEKEKKEDDELVERVELAPAREGLIAIKKAAPEFTLKNFLEGARGAFEMVFAAFKTGDKKMLEMLLSPELYKLFLEEYDKREKMDPYPDTTLVALESEQVVDARIERGRAKITVRFISEQVEVMRARGEDGKPGKIAEGDPSVTTHVEDEWTFERDLGSRNPNWKITAT